MEDEGRNDRRDRPQQKLYTPGCGPLRKTSPGSEITMESHVAETIVPPPAPRGRGHNRFRHRKGIADIPIDACQNAPRMRNDDLTDFHRRGRKPERPLYAVRPGSILHESTSLCISPDRPESSHNKVNSSVLKASALNSEQYSNSHSSSNNVNRNYRQVSEPRSVSPNYKGPGNNLFSRNRDTRSMETSAARNIIHNMHSGNKPPSGRWGSTGYQNDGRSQKFMPNLDNLPPRLKKKFLEESGRQSMDSNINNPVLDQGSQSSSAPSLPVPLWSQTLPSRGRGRIRDLEYEREREKYVASYFSYDYGGSRHSTPSGSRSNLYETSNDRFKENIVPSESSTPYSGSGVREVNHFNSESKKSLQSIDYCEKNKDDNSSHDDEFTALVKNFNNLNSLDWTEEVENNIKLEDVNTLSGNTNKTTSMQPEMKKPEGGESRHKSRHRRDRRRRSSSKRGSVAKRSRSRAKGREKSADKLATHPPVSCPHPTSRIQPPVSSMQPPLSGTQPPVSSTQPPVSSMQLSASKQDSGRDGGADSTRAASRHRERRDSHRSNRSSNIGSRDDLDRWRSLRSYSREQSPERRIMSQCSSRDPSGNRAGSPRDIDGFRIPLGHHNNGHSSRNQRRNSGSSAWSGARIGSADRSDVGSPVREAPPEGRRRRRRGGSKARAKEAERNRTPQRNRSPVPPSTINWREEILQKRGAHTDRSQESRQPAQKTSTSQQPEKSNINSSKISPNSHPGLLLLPQAPPSHISNDNSLRSPPVQTKTLYDPQNPSKPIVVQTSPISGGDSRMERMNWAAMCAPAACGGGEAARPAYYDASSDTHRAAKNRALLADVEHADTQLQQYCAAGAAALLDNWPQITETRRFLQNALQRLLLSDLKFCSTENVEHHFWKILYYKFIEVLRKHLTQESTEKERILATLNGLIEEGNKYYESLVELLEKAYKFKVDDYLNGHHLTLPKGLGYAGLGLHCVQKIYLFLGDLARYKEQVNDTTNYGKSKFWYTKAQQINPKNGRPYNQLAILAIYSRRKLDAVYYYMRSLMSSNPFESARESLISLFDENRKKYEAAERKRRAAREAARDAAGEAATARGPGGSGGARGLRREVWVRAGGGRTTTLRQDHSRDDDELADMTCVELNKTFITSYLHVHGKLITKIGMESLHESASAMLRQFRALLRRQPLPTTSTRLLQLAALNMFAVETCRTPSRGESAGGAGSGAWCECALCVALLMFGLLVERCCALLPEPPGSQAQQDALLMLPAVKVWCDWMLCHSGVWNPPPSFESFKLGADADPWEWLARLMNILEEQDDKALVFESAPADGLEAVRLSEDATMAGFTPLMYMEVEPAYAAPDPAGGVLSEHKLRTKRLLFFGTEYLLGVEPPALRLHVAPGEPPRYVSAVRPPPPPQEDEPLQDVSEDEEMEESGVGAPATFPTISETGDADEATRRLLRRKEMLEARRRNMEQRRRRMQEILRGGWVSVELEVRPRWLVPDTNCFIDHLPLLQRVALAPDQPCTLAVPLVVVRELEGLSRCSRVGGSAHAALAWLQETSAAAAPSVRFATTRGSLLLSAAFTAESGERHASNDDRVLATALGIHRNLAPQEEGNMEPDEDKRARRLVRSVVLLTDDRNLRVKALAADIPARDLPAFVQWAAIQPPPVSQALSNK